MMQEMYQNAVETLFDIDTIDKTPTADKLAEEFLTTGGGQKNRNFLGDKIRFESGVSRPMQEILLDPQTSGGMLYSVDPRDVNDIMKELNDLEMQSCVVGEVQDRQDKNIIIY